MELIHRFMAPFDVFLSQMSADNMLPASGRMSGRDVD